jgi:DNA-binding HxlR family transcriptional regulator
MSMPSAPNALSSALARVGDRWSLLVVDALMDGPRRFGEIHEAIPGIATNVLTQRLRHLEADRVLVASPYSGRPPRYSYSLTDAGRELAGAVKLLAQWSASHGEGVETSRHEACGTPLEARWWCPTCDRAVDWDSEDTVWV